MVLTFENLLSGPVDSEKELGDGLIMRSTDNLSPGKESIQAIEEREKASSVKNPVKPDQEIRINNLLTPWLRSKFLHWRNLVGRDKEFGSLTKHLLG